MELIEGAGQSLRQPRAGLAKKQVFRPVSLDAKSATVRLHLNPR